jgi:hypothetical protein
METEKVTTKDLQCTLKVALFKISIQNFDIKNWKQLILIRVGLLNSENNVRMIS